MILNCTNTKLRRWLCDMGQTTCHWCGCALGWHKSRRRKILTVDHLIPISKGGESIPENVVASCGSCNEERGNTVDEKVLEAIRGKEVHYGLNYI